MIPYKFGLHSLVCLQSQISFSIVLRNQKKKCLFSCYLVCVTFKWFSIGKGQKWRSCCINLCEIDSSGYGYKVIKKSNDIATLHCEPFCYFLVFTVVTSLQYLNTRENSLNRRKK
jgi:hypothetical protein